MKSTLLVFLLFSIALLFIIIYAIVNTETSLFYEVEESFLKSDHINSIVQVKKELFNDIIFNLKAFGIYVFTNVILIIIIIRKLR